RSTMDLFYGAYTDYNFKELPSNLPSWVCQYIKKDGSICGKDAYVRPGVSDIINLYQKK
ncbi:32737_t:CDS:1, partial [Gigaspora margarita]